MVIISLYNNIFQDRHGIAPAPPVIDSQQDWSLLMARQTDQVTVLKFTRNLNTCDPNDRVITVRCK